MEYTEIFQKSFSELKKSIEADKKLNYFKAELLKILDKQEADYKKNVEKSLDTYFYSQTLTNSMGDIEKSYGVGKLSTYTDGSVWRKISSNPSKWKMVRGPKNYNTVTHGAKIAIGKLKKQIQSCKTYDELLSIVIANKSRFVNSDGKYLPIVNELINVVHKTHEEMKNSKINVLSDAEKEKLKEYYRNKVLQSKIVELHELKEKQIANAVIPTQKEFEIYIDDLFNGNYRKIPAVIQLPKLDNELCKKIGIKGNFYLTQQRIKHINPSRKSSHNNQEFRIEEYKDILKMIKRAKKLYIDTNKGNFLIAETDKQDKEIINTIVFNKDRLGNYLVTIRKVNKGDLRKAELELVEVGVAPTITDLRDSPASKLHTGISTKDESSSINIKTSENNSVNELLEKKFENIPISTSDSDFLKYGEEHIKDVMNSNAKPYGGFSREEFNKKLDEYKKIHNNKKNIFSPSDIDKMIEFTKLNIENLQAEINKTDNVTIKSGNAVMIIQQLKAIKQLEEWFDISKTDPKFFNAEWKKYYQNHPERFTKKDVHKSFTEQIHELINDFSNK